MKRKKLFLVLFFLLQMILLADNYKITTDYFNIIYDEKIEEDALKFATNIDENAKNIFDFYKFVPSKKYNVFLKDNSDVENGYTLYDTIIIHLNQISSDKVEKNYNNWIEYVFIHELTHLILNNKAGGIIGKTYIMRPILHTMFIPAWFQEGSAIYTESSFGDGGRGNSSLFEMYLRCAVNEGNFKGLSLAGNNSIAGEMPYYYGYSFINFYVEKYGAEKYSEAVNLFLGNQIKGPFYKNSDGKSRKNIIEEWNEWCKVKYKCREGTKIGEKITDSYGEKRNLAYDSGKIFYSSEKEKEEEFGKEKDGIFSIEIGEKKVKTELNYAPTDRFYVKNGKLYYSVIIPDFIKGDYYASSYEKKLGIMFSDKYLGENRAINFIEINGKRYEVRRDSGKEKIVSSDGEILIDENNNFIFEKLFTTEKRIYFSASIKNEKGNYIYSYNAENKIIDKICEGMSPYVFDHYLYFSKIENGISNIYRINLENNNIEQITDVKYGAFEPVVLSDKKLYYINYDKKGYNIYLTDTSPIKKIEVKNIDDESITPSKEILNNDFKLIMDEKYKKNRFRDKIILKSGMITPGMIILNLSDETMEKNLILFFGGIEYKNQENKKLGIYSEEKSKKIGTAALYIHTNGGMPILVGYGENIAGKKDYADVSLMIPYFRKENKLLFITKGELDTNGKKSIGMSIFDALGYNFIHDENSVNINELYLKTKKLKVSYYFSDKDAEIEDSLYDQLIFNFKSSFKNIGYRVKGKENIVARALLDYNLEINKGNITGRNVLKNINFGVENLYTKWGSENDKREDYAANFFLGTELYLNYVIKLNASVGIIEQYDLKIGKHKDGSEIPYFKIGAVF